MISSALIDSSHLSDPFRPIPSVSPDHYYPSPSSPVSAPSKRQATFPPFLPFLRRITLHAALSLADQSSERVCESRRVRDSQSISAFDAPYSSPLSNENTHRPERYNVRHNDCANRLFSGTVANKFYWQRSPVSYVVLLFYAFILNIRDSHSKNLALYTIVISWLLVFRNIYFSSLNLSIRAHSSFREDYCWAHWTLPIDNNYSNAPRISRTIDILRCLPYRMWLLLSYLFSATLRGAVIPSFYAAVSTPHMRILIASSFRRRRRQNDADSPK